jgi:hypothetical protein
MLHRALGDERRHDVVGVVRSLPPLKSQRESQRVGDVVRRGGD